MTADKKNKEEPAGGSERLAEILDKERPRPGQPEIPEVLAVLPVMELNLFPMMIFPLMIIDPRAMGVIEDSMHQGRIIGLFAFKTPPENQEPPTSENFYEVGAAAYVLKMTRGEDGSMMVLAQGLSRIRLLELVEDDPYLRARVAPLADEYVMDQETTALMTSVRDNFRKVLEMSPNLPKELAVMNQNVENPSLLADMVASALNIKKEEKQDILSTLEVKRRLEKVLMLLQTQLELLELSNKIHSRIKGKIDKSQREFYLREQLKALQDELGEKDQTDVELDDLTSKTRDKKLTEEARTAAQRELDRLKRMNPASAEYTVARTYLDWILDLPWLETTPDDIKVEQAQAILDHDHYDLEKVKKRIVEYLAVLELKKDMKGPILCFVGPPGTGKTSLGHSIARAMGRKFVRISLGGVRDEAEIRGHRRTYVGALPGRIIQGLKKVGVSNPVFMLDEIDKLGADFRGDPSSALLEVLDPEQNNSFADHYLEIEYDLSKVLFIATANVLDTIPGPLRDRMEILTLSGYTGEEKLMIAKRFLVARQREAHGLKPGRIVFRDGAIKRIIGEYTREAGLRNLEREIANVCRHVAVRTAKGEAGTTIVTAAAVPSILGPRKFENETRARTAKPGVATGLAWTAAGGDILFIEAAAMPGKGGLTLTGQLGDVMKESAQAALSVVRSRTKELGVADDFFSQHDLHVHVPAGAIPKDGPSAGVTLTAALVSLVTGRKIKSDTAMTGEITLRGLVLPVGGIKEKVLAAKRAGIKHVILPVRNETDLAEISDSLKSGIEIHPVGAIEEVLKLALEG
ncbi:MAG: endopeptidase La [Pseudomonadota bacterium]